jgi:hypothetical protein
MVHLIDLLWMIKLVATTIKWENVYPFNGHISVSDEMEAAAQGTLVTGRLKLSRICLVWLNWSHHPYYWGRLTSVTCGSPSTSCK